MKRITGLCLVLSVALFATGSTLPDDGTGGRFSCFIEAATVTTQCYPAPATGLRILITDVSLSNQAVTAQSLDIVYGTGVNCATGTTAITHKIQLGTNATTTSPFVVSMDLTSPLIPASAKAICVRPSAATAYGATITGYVAY